MKTLLDLLLKKTSLRVKFRVIILLILFTGLSYVIGILGLLKTNNLLHVEREFVVSTKDVKIKLLEYEKNPANKQIINELKQTLSHHWKNELFPQQEIILDAPYIGGIEALAFKIFFNDEVNKGREILKAEKEIVKDLYTFIDGYSQDQITKKIFIERSEKDFVQLSTLSTELKNLSSTISSKVFTLILVTTIIFLIATMVLINFLLIYIRKSIIRFIETIEQIAEGEGDLTVEIPSDSQDTLGMLSRSFNIFLNTIKTLIIELKESISHVQESSQSIFDFVQESSKDVNDIMSEVDEINQNAERQKENVLKTIEMIHEVFDLMKTMADDIESETQTITNTSYTTKYMVNQFKLIADSSKKVDDSAKELLKVAKEGGNTVNKTLQSIQEIQEDSSKIEDIVHVISNIAEQTNLLAMNAAIEAAHAGEYGKGFAVVADEVRKLAENSSQASQEIISLIKNTVEKIQISAELSTHSYEALQTILEDTEITTKFVNDVTSGLNDMTNEANEILEDIEEVNRITLKVKESAEESREKGKVVLEAVHEVKEYAVNITGSLQEQIIHSRSIAKNVENLSDFSQLNQKFVDYLIDISDRFKTE